MNLRSLSISTPSLPENLDIYTSGIYQFLINALGLTRPEQVFAILEKYYPRQQIKPATQYFVEELFGQ